MNSYMITKETNAVLKEVSKERWKQDLKWGEQNHDGPLYLTILSEEVGEVGKAILDFRFGKKDLEEIRAELIQVAAVAVAMIEAFDRGHCR